MLELREENIHILSIGINQYKSKRVRDLRYAVNDARDFFYLITENFPSITSKVLLIDQAATKSRIRFEIQKLFENKKSDDLVFFFYAGHGTRNFYLSSYNTSIDSIVPSSVDMSIIQQMFDECDAGRVFFFLDCCFSGGMTEDIITLRKQVESTFGDSPDYFHSRFIDNSPPIPVMKGIDILQGFLGENKGFITACNEEQQAQEHDSIKHGIFTFQLLNMLKGKNINVTSDRIDFEQLVKSLQNHTPKMIESINKQRDRYSLELTLQHPQSYTLKDSYFTIPRLLKK